MNKSFLIKKGFSQQQLIIISSFVLAIVLVIVFIAFDFINNNAQESNTNVDSTSVTQEVQESESLDLVDQNDDQIDVDTPVISEDNVDLELESLEKDIESIELNLGDDEDISNESLNP